MSGTTQSERRRMRERKKRELQDHLDGETGPARNEPIDVEDRDHLDEIVEREDLVLVDCYADWCGPCQMLESTIETIAAETVATVATVDVDANPHIAQELGARSVPTLVFFAAGRQQDRLVGVQDRATIEDVIDRLA